MIFQLKDIVESKICDEIENINGAILFDGRTINDTHYVSVMLSCMRTVWTPVDGRRSSELVQSCSVVPTSYMYNMSESNSDQLLKGASTFNAVMNFEYFKSTISSHWQSMGRLGNGIDSGLHIRKIKNCYCSQPSRDWMML